MKSVLIVVGVFGVSLVALAWWVAWGIVRAQRRSGHDPTLTIRPPRIRYDTADESLPAKTEQRRSQAAAKRKEAQQIESGRSVEDRIIKLVGRR